MIYIPDKHLPRANRKQPGINDQPAYLKDYPGKELKETIPRKVTFNGPVWSDDGKNAVVHILTLDFKDRWICLLIVLDGTLKVLNHQQDEAWIGGPGIGWWGGVLGWIPNTNKIYFQSEESGYSHLYTVDSKNLKNRALTTGHYEIYSPFISKDKAFWYFSANPENSGIRNFYKMPISGGVITIMNICSIISWWIIRGIYDPYGTLYTTRYFCLWSSTPVGYRLGKLFEENLK